MAQSTNHNNGDPFGIILQEIQNHLKKLESELSTFRQKKSALEGELDSCRQKTEEQARELKTLRQ